MMSKASAPPWQCISSTACCPSLATVTLLFPTRFTTRNANCASCSYSASNYLFAWAYVTDWTTSSITPGWRTLPSSVPCCLLPIAPAVDGKYSLLHWSLAHIHGPTLRPSECSVCHRQTHFQSLLQPMCLHAWLQSHTQTTLHKNKPSQGHLALKLHAT